MSEEAARLVAALRAARGAASPTPAGPDAAPEPSVAAADPAPAAAHEEAGAHGEAGDEQQTHDPACTVCPVCIGLRAARSISPETVDAVADVLALGVQALRDLAATGRERSAGTAAADDTHPPADTDPGATT